MQIKTYSGDLPAGRRRGRGPDEIATALMGAIDTAVQTGKPQAVTDLESAKEVANLSTRVRLYARKRDLDVSIITLEDKTGFIFAITNANGAPVAPEPAEGPKRTSRKARK